MNLALTFFGLVGAVTIYLGYRLIIIGSTNGFSFTAELRGWGLTLASITPGMFVVLCGTCICIYSLRLLAGHHVKSAADKHPVQRDPVRVPALEHNIVKSKKAPELTFLGASVLSRLPSVLKLRNRLWIPLGITIGVLIGVFLIYAVLRPSRTVLAEEEANDTVNVIRSRISSISLEESHLIFKNTNPPMIQFMLTINPTATGSGDAVYLFKQYEYTLETGGDETKAPTAQICQLVDAIYDRREPILESLKQVQLEGKLSFPIWKGASGEIKVGNVTPILVEILYSIRRFYELKSSHPEIMIRGYADGQIADWDRPLLNDPYHYSSIRIYPAVHSDSKNPNTFIKQEAVVSMPAKYKNRHLPDLRAHFVKMDLVDPYLKDCRNYQQAESHVVQGYAFEATKQPLERKVQVFILLFKN